MGREVMDVNEKNIKRTEKFIRHAVAALGGRRTGRSAGRLLPSAHGGHHVHERESPALRPGRQTLYPCPRMCANPCWTRSESRRTSEPAARTGRGEKSDWFAPREDYTQIYADYREEDWEAYLAGDDARRTDLVQNPPSLYLVTEAEELAGPPRGVR